MQRTIRNLCEILSNHTIPIIMKPAVYSQLYIQLVFAVRNRNASLVPGIRDRVFQYMGGIVSDMGHKSIIINGTSNHVHLFIGWNPSISLSETVHDVKRSSSLFINEQKLCSGSFYWQDGYGAFSYSQSHIDQVYNYILNQETHHRQKTFREEYVEFLQKFAVDYNEKYLFDFWEDDQ